MTEESTILARFPMQSGVIFGLVPLPVHIFLPTALSQQLAGITVVLIAGVYIGYAFKDGRKHVIAIELSTALVFAAAAWLGINGVPQAILAVLVLHGIWDLLHHRMIDTEVPRWYVPFCAVVDWVMAASLLMIWTFH